MIKKVTFVIVTLSFIFLAIDVEAAFTKTLTRGISHRDVSELQRVLSMFLDIYPEKMITGFFGMKTEEAVKRFQKKYGIEQTGIVGPKTRAKLNETLVSAPPPFPKRMSPSLQSISPIPTPYSSSVPLNDLNRWSVGKCQGKGSVTLTFPPIKMDDVSYILPMGRMSSSHVTPVDHLYFHTSHKTINHYDVLAVADGYVVSVERVGDTQDFRLILEHTCTFYSIYIHVTELAPKISAATGFFTQGSKAIRVPVRAGEVIGTKIPEINSKTFQVDFSVANSEVTLKGFVMPEHYYIAEPWKIHTDDLYAYYKDPLRAQMIAKTIRTTEPISGKIDYDIDGRLVGNWFRVGTNGYSGSNSYQYWEGHLAIAYDYLDPITIRISMGNWQGKSEQFVVRGNTPDPKEISVQTGPIKYELLLSNYVKINGEPWDQETFTHGVRVDVSSVYLFGTLLVQLIDERKLKLETFPGKSASEVAGFTANAVIYER